MDGARRFYLRGLLPAAFAVGSLTWLGGCDFGQNSPPPPHTFPTFEFDASTFDVTVPEAMAPPVSPEAAAPDATTPDAAVIDAAQVDATTPDAPAADAAVPVDAAVDVTASPAVFSVMPASYDFGSLTVGVASAPQTFTVTNTGGTDSGTPTVAGGGANAADFVVGANTCTAALTAGATCSFTVVFTPSAAAPESATVTVSAASTGQGSASLTGSGLAPAALVVAPSSHDFGSVTQGTASGDFPFAVTNDGGVTSGALAVSVTGTNAASFPLGTETCTGVQLAAGGAAQCTVNVHFQPNSSTTGSTQASLVISGTPGGTTTATLLGTATTPASLSITDSVSQNPYGFGSQTQGTPSVTEVFTVTNSGGSASGTPTVTVTGPNPSDFQVMSNTCTASLAASTGQCQVGVRFVPSTTSAESATLTVTAAPGGAPTMGLQGTGAAPVPAITVSPTMWQPPATSETSTTPPSQLFTVTNKGTGPTSALAISGLANGFALAATGDGCSGTMLSAGGGMCTFSVVFQPSVNQAPGPAAATLTVTDSAADVTTASLSSVALYPTYYLVVTPNPGNWGTVTEGAAPAPLTFTVTNYGAGAAPGIGGFNITNVGNLPVTFARPAATDNCTGTALGAYGSGSDTCTFVETFQAPVGVPAGSLPTSPMSTIGPLNGTTGAPLAGVPAGLEAMW